MKRNKKKESGQIQPSNLSSNVNQIFSSFCDVKIMPIIWWTNVEQVLQDPQSIEISFAFNILTTHHVIAMTLTIYILNFSFAILLLRQLTIELNRGVIYIIIVYIGIRFVMMYHIHCFWCLIRDSRTLMYSFSITLRNSPPRLVARIRSFRP